LPDTIAASAADEFTVMCEDLGAVNDAGGSRIGSATTLERPFTLRTERRSA